MLTADRTRSRRYRAGSRRNKRLKNVGSFESDFRESDREYDDTFLLDVSFQRLATDMDNVVTHVSLLDRVFRRVVKGA